VPALEAWQKVFIDLSNDNGKDFIASVHGPKYAGQAISHKLSCQACHAGPADNTFEGMTEGHQGMVLDPSSPGDVGCNVSGCHDDQPFESVSYTHLTLPTILRV